MQIIKYKNLKQPELEKIFLRSSSDSKRVSKVVAAITQEVKEKGDAELLRLTKKFDGADLKDLKVSKEEITQAYKNVSVEFLEAIDTSIANQKKFQTSIFSSKSEKIETTPGITVWREWRAIESIGLYVPGGRARYPSSIVMAGVPAKVAGCEQIVMCTPPDENGNIPAATLVAADKVGVTNIYKVGGAQAIAAMALGTESISKVYKIFGAGNAYVTEAKMQLFGEVDIDMPAGPSEVMVIADNSANPAWVAADLLSQCEHGPDSAAVLVTDSLELAEKVKGECYKQAQTLTTKETIEQSLASYGACIVVEDIKQSVEIANTYAPEHLEIITKDYFEIAKRINNAGSVFLGPYSCEPIGDYASGSNHVLPTNGYAKMFSGLSVDSFGKWQEFQEISKDGFRNIASAVITLAETETLPAHANSIYVRERE